MQTSALDSESSCIYEWQWSGQAVQVAYSRWGQGTPVLLLPAFSTVSSRHEWQDAAQTLAAEGYEVTCIDWPGFGDSSRPALDYSPVLFEAFLPDFVRSCFERPINVVAAGHSAGFALQLAHQLPRQVLKLILVAPTWRGPLPTMGVPKQIARGVEQLVRSPVIGQALYFLNTRPSFLQWMYRRHVFTEPQRLTPTFMREKYETTQQKGARFGPAAFVTGGLDPVTNRGAFLQLFQDLKAPCLILASADGPPKSKAEMEAIAQLPHIRLQMHPGSLGLHEEYGNEVGEIIRSFLAE
ncbi:MAG TPA: alpha/beta hydrolase [Stenomitos sp.]